MPLTYFKMSSGEEMIAQVKEVFHDRLVVEKPVLILMIPSPINPRHVSVNLVGFIPTKQLFMKDMNLRIANIVLDVEMDADDPLVEKYNRLMEMYERMPSNPADYEKEEPELLNEGEEGTEGEGEDSTWKDKFPTIKKYMN